MFVARCGIIGQCPRDRISIFTAYVVVVPAVAVPPQLVDKTTGILVEHMLRKLSREHIAGLTWPNAKGAPVAAVESL